jgi:hypothetical protein
LQASVSSQTPPFSSNTNKTAITTEHQPFNIQTLPNSRTLLYRPTSPVRSSYRCRLPSPVVCQEAYLRVDGYTTIITTCQRIRHLQRALPQPYRNYSLAVALVRGDITCPGVCTCALDYCSRSALRGCRQLRRGAVRDQGKTTPFGPATNNGHAARGTRIVFGFRRKKVLFHHFFASLLLSVTKFLYFHVSSFVSAASTLICAGR